MYEGIQDIGRWGGKLPEDIALLAQRSKKNFKGRLEEQNPKNSKSGLRGAKSLGEDLPRGPIYGGVKFEGSLVVGMP